MELASGDEEAVVPDAVFAVDDGTCVESEWSGCETVDCC